MKIKFLINIAIITIAMFLSNVAFAKSRELLNASYDPTRELYEEYNQYFINDWKQKTGEEIRIKQSHGGSGKQARSVIDGLEADVVTLALGYDISTIARQANLFSSQWQNKFAHNSSPYNSAIIFLVRKNNPKHIKDWNDLIKNNIQIITPNPKTSGGARWNYLAALGYANKKFASDPAKVQEFLTALFANVVIYDTGARGSSITFAKRNIGDVLIAWENEALLLKKQFGNEFEIVTPSISILAEPPVAVVDKFAAKHNTFDLAKAYLQGLYSDEAQDIIAKNFYRPTNIKILKKYQEKFPGQFPKIQLITINDLGGWDLVQKKHFDDGGIFDQITKRK
jgi:sulfate/thiosulfate-binding protein